MNLWLLSEKSTEPRWVAAVAPPHPRACAARAAEIHKAQGINGGCWEDGHDRRQVINQL